jgi:4-amino-4-deoxy-L-arabinose transferase-like glycosyltransferase
MSRDAGGTPMQAHVLGSHQGTAGTPCVATGAQTGTNVLLGSLAVLALLIHCVTNSAYGYFRDELYYIACSNHLAAGYVDHPPLSIVLLAASRRLLGDSLPAIRLLPALAAAGLVALTGLLARALGGGRTAQALAALAVLVAPGYLVVHGFFSMNAFEPLFWGLAAYLLIQLLNTGNRTLWVPFGVVVGLGLENKHAMLFFGFGVAAALLLTPHRRLLRDKWLWAGGGLAALIFLPNLVWEATHHWPTVEFMRNAQAYKNAPISPAEFFAGQVMTLHPLTAPLWLAGLVFFLWSAAGRRYRLLGWIYVVICLLFIVEQAKVYYLMPIYPMLFAAGAVAAETWTQRRARWIRPAYVAVLVAGGLATAPMAVPVLPVETFIRYAHTLGLSQQAQKAVSERNEAAELPQYFADMFGWDDLVATIAQAYDSLPAADRARAAIFVQNYGEAAAIDFFGPAYQLPPAISGHNNYWLWGPRGATGEVVIVLGGSADQLASQCESVEPLGVVRCRYCMPFEDNRPIHLCRHLKQPLEQLWAQLKRYI